jgi:hypothetical protein
MKGRLLRVEINGALEIGDRAVAIVLLHSQFAERIKDFRGRRIQRGS